MSIHMHFVKKCLFSTDKEVTSGEIDVTAKLFGIPVLRTKYSLCDIVEGGCPIQGKMYCIMLVELV